MLKKNREAEELFKSALIIFNKSELRTDEVALIQCITRLGNVLLAQGKHDEAERFLLPFYKKVQDQGAFQRSVGVVYCLGRLCYDEARFVEAKAFFEHAFDLSRGSPLEPIIQTSYQSLLWEMGEAEAAALENQALRRSQFVAFVESRTLITRECVLDGEARQYNLEVELKIAVDHHINGKRKLQEGNVLVASFEHPNKEAAPVEVEHVIQASDVIVSLKSPVLEGEEKIAGHQFYEVIVRVYSDSTRENIIASHHQLTVERTGAQRSQRG